MDASALRSNTDFLKGLVLMPVFLIFTDFVKLKELVLHLNLLNDEIVPLMN